MPANLTPAYRSAEQRFREAKTIPDKLDALDEMWAFLPKHKGTDKIQADIKRRTARLRREGEKKGGPAHHAVKVVREGAGQVVLVGAPNSGKSQLLASLTGAHPTVAEYPYATRIPLPGMMPYKDVQVQLVDTPPIAPGYVEPYLPSMVRGADAVILVVNLAEKDFCGQVEPVLREMGSRKVSLVGEPGKVQLESGVVEKRTLMIATRRYLPKALADLPALEAAYGECFLIVAVSAPASEELEPLRETIFSLLGCIRIYTKAPGKPPDREHPYTVLIGTTVMDLAKIVHKDFASSLKFARIWGVGTRDGQRVERVHALHDGDMVELHI